MFQQLEERSLKFKCDQCDCQFSYKKNFIYHKRKRHQIQFEEKCLEFKCDPCDSQFSVEKSLKYHKRKRHQNEIDAKCLEFKCDLCDRQFSHEKNLKYHKRKQHQIEFEAKCLEFKCDQCDSQFSVEKYLKYHKRKRHQKEIDAKCLEFKCDHCDRQFSHKRNLRYHMRKQHQIELDVKCLLFKCNQCDSQFSHLRNLKYHKHKKHMTKTAFSHNLVCPVCQENIKKSAIITHFTDSHDIKIENSELKFPTLENFEIWKADMEASTKSKFVMYGHNIQTLNNNEIYYFRCHRSGDFHSKGKGVRYLKRLGSNKINAYCPAKIKVIKLDGGDCTVNFQSTHVGHEKDLRHLFLTNDERNYIASKINADFSFDSILEEVKDSITESGLQRLHLLTKKDLHNIKKSFNCSTATSNTNTIPDESRISENIDESNAVVKELSCADEMQTPEINHYEKQESLIKKLILITESFTDAGQYEIMEKTLKSLIPKLNTVNHMNSSALITSKT